MNAKKIIGVLLVVCFVMSVTAGAVSAKPGWGNHPLVRLDAKNDRFHQNFGNVLFNDNGIGLKVVKTWGAKGEVVMKKNGWFFYTPSYRSIHKGVVKDTFMYMVKDKYGRYDIAKVTISYKVRNYNEHEGHNNGPR